MSTFKGVMEEFPEIRVDYFRTVLGYPAPLACFLSHVHSDHLAGLETPTFNATFIYCSFATRQLLLGLEKYPHKLNFALGITEVRKQTYKHLDKRLKPIPMETPTMLELAPEKHIRVTLFDANHCTGAVMFLFEDEHSAVLYTGDIRSEPWFVNNLTRNPHLIEYTFNKTLDCIYLDTSFTSPMKFPTKAEGVSELLGKLAKYPSTTIFHFAAWTFGYEEVWMVLSKYLKSRIHVTDYTCRLYESLVKFPKKAGSSEGPATHATPEAAALAGFTVGNKCHDGMLTTQASTMKATKGGKGETIEEFVRLHSCEKGMRCDVVKSNKVVWIRPIICRTPSGQDVSEMGIGGGGGDLIQRQELLLDAPTICQLLMMFMANHPGEFDKIENVKTLLLSAQQSNIALSNQLRDAEQMEPFKVEELYQEFSMRLLQQHESSPPPIEESAGSLPSVITFPYSRHSSYEELCNLLEAFKPRDVWPCTVDENRWSEDSSIEALFGRYCSGSDFRHDNLMRSMYSHDDEESDEGRRDQRTPSPDNSDNSQHTRSEESSQASEPPNSASNVAGPRISLNNESSSSQILSQGHAAAGTIAARSSVATRSATKHPHSKRTVNQSVAGGSTDDAIASTGSPYQEPISGFEASTCKRRRVIDREEDRSDGPDDFAPAEEDVTFHDEEDGIHRCASCGWEWDRLNGECCRLDCTSVSEPIRCEWEVAEAIPDKPPKEWSWERVMDEDLVNTAEAYAYESEDSDLHSMIDDDDHSTNDVEIDHSNDSDAIRTVTDDHGAPPHAEVEESELPNGKAHRGSSDGLSITDLLSQNGLSAQLLPSATEQPQLGGDSQASLASSERLADRQAAYEAALDLDNGWTRSLLSVDDNHSILDVVL